MAQYRGLARPAARRDPRERDVAMRERRTWTPPRAALRSGRNPRSPTRRATNRPKMTGLAITGCRRGSGEDEHCRGREKVDHSAQSKPARLRVARVPAPCQQASAIGGGPIGKRLPRKLPTSHRACEDAAHRGPERDRQSATPRRSRRPMPRLAPRTSAARAGPRLQDRAPRRLLSPRAKG